MKQLGAWLRQFSENMTRSIRRFMEGRYGTDRLNMAILSAGLGACIVSMLLRGTVLRLLFTLLSYALMIWAISRALSHNTYRRYQENRKYLQLFDRMKDRNNRYFDCPKCRQVVRVPRGKGKIAITCPKCREKFIRKT